MAFYYSEPSHTFSEYLLVPGYSSSECTPANASLKTPLVKFKKGEESAITMNIPMVSAIMQSVSGEKLAIALAKEGGISFIYGSQTIEAQAAMVKRVKSYKAGFVTSVSNIKPDQTLADILALKEKTGHSTVAVTDDGSANGKLIGIVTSRDYRVSRMDPATKVSEFMTPIENLVYAEEGTSLKEANNIIWDNKLNALPIVDKNGNLVSFVFRKDYDSHKENPMELLDKSKRYVVGAGINTRDYAERVPALVEAGADVLCIDSSEGFSEWQKLTIDWIREHYGDTVKVGAVIEVAKARDEYYEETGIYIPICSDGGIVHDYHITLALAMGCDFCMLGRYFSRFEESPTNKVIVNGNYMKEYWGEGSARARNWQRYDVGGAGKLSFEEGVDSYVPYAGYLHDNVAVTLAKVKHTMCNCGALTIPELQEKAKLTLVSSVSIVEGGAHDVVLKDQAAVSVK